MPNSFFPVQFTEVSLADVMNSTEIFEGTADSVNPMVFRDSVIEVMFTRGIQFFGEAVFEWPLEYINF